MKTVNNNKITRLFYVLLLAILISCSEDDDMSNIIVGDIINGITEEEIGAYAGDIGFLVNVRDIRKKGYNPVKARISTNASQVNYDQDLVINSFTDLAQLSLSVEDLSESEESELRNGVSLEIEIIDSSNAVITTETYSVFAFSDTNNEIFIDASSLAFQDVELSFNPNSRYYLQLVNPDGSYGNTVLWKPSSAGSSGVELQERSSSFWPGTTSEQFMLYKLNGEENKYSIYSANTNRFLTIGNQTRILRQSGVYSYPTADANNLNSDYHFTIRREDNDLYTIVSPTNNRPLRRYLTGGSWKWHTETNGTIQYFRIIALDIEWESDELDTEFMQPIMPAVQTSFGFNSTLKNCGTGTLEQQVGIEEEVTTTFTSGFSESIGLSGRTTTSVDVSVSATASASFFGNGGSVTGEVSTGLEVSVEASSTSTASTEESVSNTNKFFSTRLVEVPPGSASLVYDAYQTYSNVKVPYVKRIRLKGFDTHSSQFLVGKDIATQLKMTNFTGVITSIGSDFVEISIKGNMTLDNILDTQTEVRDVPVNCDN